MAKKRFQAEQIIGKLREAEVEIFKGQTIGVHLTRPRRYSPALGLEYILSLAAAGQGSWLTRLCGAENLNLPVSGRRIHICRPC